MINMLVPSVVAAEPESENFSNWNWDEVPLESNQDGTATRPNGPTTKDQGQAPSSVETVTPPQESAEETASSAEESTSSETEPDAKRQQSEISKSDPISPDPDKGAMEFDLDWPEDMQIDDKAADETTSRRATQAKKLAELAKKPRVGSTAEPDFAGNILEGYQLFDNMRPFIVIPSQKDPDMHPCLDCHDWAESDLTPRRLKEPHDNFRLQHGLHGKGEFWCLTCHHLEGDGGLKTFEGVKLSFDEAYILCSQCHAQEAKDWSFGAHGKRVDNWQGERRILNCTACHYQHQPRYVPRKPMPGPSLRMGLNRPGHPTQGAQGPGEKHKVVRVWERYSKEQGQE
jgi:hypothetical protein